MDRGEGGGHIMDRGGGKKCFGSLTCQKPTKPPFM